MLGVEKPNTNLHAIPRPNTSPNQAAGERIQEGTFSGPPVTFEYLLPCRKNELLL